MSLPDWITQISRLAAVEWTAALLTVAFVLLSTGQNILCWIFGLVAAALYAWVYLQYGLISSAALQCCFIGLQAYGWWAWLRNPAGGDGHRPVTRASRLQVALFAALGVLAAFLWGRFVLARQPEVRLPYHDAAGMMYSLLFQFWMSRKVLECWMGWVGVNIFYVWLFSVSGLHVTAALYALMTGLAVKGWYDWKSTLSAPRTDG